MTDHEHVDHAENVQNAGSVNQAAYVEHADAAIVASPALTPTKAVDRTRKLGYVTIICACLVVALALFSAIYKGHNADRAVEIANQQARLAQQQRADLAQQLAALNANDAVAQAKMACTNAYGREITAASQAAFAASQEADDLFKAFVYQVIDPRADRGALIANYDTITAPGREATERSTVASAAYQKAVADRDAYAAAASPLPCPIPT